MGTRKTVLSSAQVSNKGFDVHFPADPIIADAAGTLARLDDGRPVLLRRGRPTDGPAVRALHERLSLDSMRSRYFCARACPEAEEIACRLRADHDHGTLVAVVGSAVVGLAEVDRVEPTVAEIALLVDDAHQGLGLGTLLLQQLALAAAASGLTALVGETLRSNARMRRMLDGCGLGPRRRHESEAVMLTFRPDAVSLARAAHAAELRRTLVATEESADGSQRRPA